MDSTLRVRMLSCQVEPAPLGVLGEGQEYDLPEALARRWAGLGLARILERRPVASPVRDAVGDHVVPPAPELEQTSGTRGEVPAGTRKRRK